MKYELVPLAVLAALASAISQAAQSGESTITLGEVHVDGSAGQSLQAGSSSVLTSVDVLGADKIEKQNVSNSWELLGQMPGIQLTETRQGAESGKATFRAFNGEGYINGIKTLIDGAHTSSKNELKANAWALRSDPVTLAALRQAADQITYDPWGWAIECQQRAMRWQQK